MQGQVRVCVHVWCWSLSDEYECRAKCAWCVGVCVWCLVYLVFARRVYEVCGCGVGTVVVYPAIAQKKLSSLKNGLSSCSRNINILYES